MISALIYKEWIKSRKMIFAGFITTFLLYTFWFIKLHNQWLEEQSIMFNFKIANMGWLFHDILKYSALLIPFFLALFQYIPEVKNTRYKLQYMLPLSNSKLTLYPIIFGIGIILIFSVLYISTYFILSTTILPDYLVTEGLQNMLTWLIGSFMVYFLTITVVVDPQWVRKISIGIIGLCFLVIVYFPTQLCTTHSLNWQLAILVIIGAGVPWYSLYNLRKSK